MYFFSPADEEKLSQLQRDKLYLADRLIEDIDEALEDTSKKNLRTIKSAILDIVALENVLKKLGFKSRLQGDLRKIRNSLSHIDERMESFDFKPVKIDGFNVKREAIGNQFKHSVNINFQGAITNTGISVPVDDSSAYVKVVSLFGMVDNYFLWVSKTGAQKFTSIETIKSEYQEFLAKIRE